MFPSLKAIDLRIRRRVFGLNHKFLVRRVTFHGRSWQIPVIDYMGYGLAQGHEPEPWIYSALKTLFEEQKIAGFIDIGANIGQTLIKVKSLDPDIPYFAFEPNPNCIYYLDHLIRLNNINHTALHCIGIGSSQFIAEFQYSGKDDVCGRFSTNQTISKKLPCVIAAPVWPLDQFSFPIDRDGTVILKIDVEGYEKEVLAGARNFVTTFNPVLFIEILPHQHIPELISNAKSVFALLQEWGYKAYQIERSGQQVEVPGFRDNPADYESIDYLFMPPGR